MKKILAVSVLLFVWCNMLVLLTFQTAPAALVTAEDPDVIVAMAKGYGSAILDKDRDGDPKISCRMDGKAYTIFFYGCSNGKNCTSIQLWASWDKKLEYNDVNAWNKKTRYTRAYIDEDGDFTLELDIMLRSGITEKSLDQYFGIWQSRIKAFKKEVLKE